MSSACAEAALARRAATAQESIEFGTMAISGFVFEF
jgi:hypothetical protein